MSKPATVDAYIAAQPEPARAAATAVREAIRKAVPDAEEKISYGIAAFRRDGRNFLYLGAWKSHIGLYPIYRGDEAFEAEVGPYRAKTDTVQLPYKYETPLALVERIARAQAGL